MKKIAIAYTLFLIHPIAHPNTQQAIKLEQKFLVHADGTFIKADLIEQMQQLQRHLFTILYGNNAPLGSYTYNNTIYNLNGLTKITPRTSQDKTVFDKCFMQAKAEFVRVGSGLQGTGNMHKLFMGKLIKESCEKRQRKNSPLISWSHATNDQTFLDTQIKSVQEFAMFLNDLHNFLSDLIHSCPKAFVMHTDRMKKIEKINNLCQEIPTLKDNIALRIKFLSFIKEKELHKLKESDFTQKYITALFRKFSRTS